MRIDFDDLAVGTFNFELVRALNSLATGGAELGEVVAIAQAIPDDDFDGWERAWSTGADRLAGLATDALARGSRHTARGQLLRASNYYRSAAFYAKPGGDAHHSLWNRSRVTFEQAAPLLDPPVRVIDVPFGDSFLPAYYCQGSGTPAPTLVAHGGYDSTMEELYHWIAVATMERGWNCLCFEGPGQWAARYRTGATFRPDWEIPVSAAVDWVLARPEVDAGKVALVGYSLGGNLAPRAAAFESRLAACVANSLLVNFGARLQFPGLTDDQVDEFAAALMSQTVVMRWFVEHGRWSTGIDRPSALFKFLGTFDLTGLGSKITCPLLNIVGESEIGTLVDSTTVDLLADVPRASSHLFLKEDEGLAAAHCQPATMRRAQEVTLDWLYDVFAGRDLLPAIPETLRQTVQRVEERQPA